MAETEAIFANVAAARERAAGDPSCLRLSRDTKAKVKIGPFSRGGRARTLVQAMDHDRHPEALLVPFGVREVSRGKAAINPLNILFGQSRETSDFIADALQRWWSSRRPSPPDIRKRMIELDHGPEISGVRTPFLKRLVEFSHASQREIERLPFPPYHRKDNPIERCWGVLENHGSGPLLTAIDTALRTAATMTWRGVSPRVDPLTTTYERGGRLTKKLFRDVARKLQRSSTLPQWSLSITPNSA